MVNKLTLSFKHGTLLPTGISFPKFIINPLLYDSYKVYVEGRNNNCYKNI